MDPISTKYTRGNNPLIIDDAASEYTLLDFWSWAFSDVLTNTTRGMLAEFIIAMALGIDLKKPRDVWGKFDLTYRNHGIEVKSASFHQKWYQQRLSTISFNVSKRKGWDENTNKFEPISRRQADIYVLSLLSEKDREKVNPLNMDQWRFWVIGTSFFDNRPRSQHSITYNSLIKEIGVPIIYAQLKMAIDGLIEKK
jgi:hypothetical protein